MPTLILIRHASPAIDQSVNAHQWPLSVQGRARARRFAAKVAPLKPQVIFTSEEPKATETGRILAAELALPTSTVAGLGEHDRRNVPWEGTSVFQHRVERFFSHPDALVFGGETASQAGRRFSSTVDTLLREYGGQNVAIVSHGTVMSLYVAARTGRDPWNLWRQLQALGMPALVALALPAFQLVDMEGLPIE